MDSTSFSTEEKTAQNLACNELSDSSPDGQSSCPLMDKVTLLPIRYGRVEIPPKEHNGGMPYNLASRPIGYRLLRDGYIYVYDEKASSLKEHRYSEHEISGGKLEYEVGRTLYVCFSEIPWTSRKKAQILENKEDRHHWMQRIDLSNTSACSGGRNLLTVSDASDLVAEFSEDYQPEKPDKAYEEETEPYVWEKDRKVYKKTRIGELLGQQDGDPENSLCMVLRDDLGVLFDLADHQDEVVSWIEKWQGAGHNKRNYILGTMIESLTLIDSAGVELLLSSKDGDDIQTLKQSLDAMPLEDRYVVENELVSYLNSLEDNPVPTLWDRSGANFDPEFENELSQITRRYSQDRSNKVVIEREMAIRKWHVKDGFNNDQFVEEHLDGIVELQRKHEKHLKGVLDGGIHGKGAGSLGVNERIDRREMDSFMAEERLKLSRWNDLLDKISDDRATMIGNCYFHTSTWYFDCWDESQVLHALDIELMAMRDICRSDSASEKILEWLNAYPQYSVLLFSTLPLSEQKSGSELTAEILKLHGAGYSTLTNAKDLGQSLHNAELKNLPDIERMSEEIQLKAQAIGDVLAPAIARSLAVTITNLYSDIGKRQLPSMDELFRDLPFFLKRKVVKEVRAGNMEFVVRSPAEAEVFANNIRKLYALSQQTTTGRSNSRKVSDFFKEDFVENFKSVRETHREFGPKVLQALSPIDGTDKRVVLASGKARLSLSLAEGKSEKLSEIFENRKVGMKSVIEAGSFGDVVALGIFLAQLANLKGAIEEYIEQAPGERDFMMPVKAFTAAAGTGFLIAQGLGDAILGARAKILAQHMASYKLNGIEVKMGKMHFSLGLAAYSLGFIASLSGVFSGIGNWADAVRSGKTNAQAGALMSVVGHSGIAGVNFYGALRSVNAAIEVKYAPNSPGKSTSLLVDEAKSTAWARAGTSLSGLFRTLNWVGLAFTVLELAGTWIYNRFNTSRLDEWLDATPWANKTPRSLQDESLDSFKEEFSKIMVGANFERLLQDSEIEYDPARINFYDLPPDAIYGGPGVAPLYKIEVCAWRVKPKENEFNPEMWMSCTNEILHSMKVVWDKGHLQLELLHPPLKDRKVSGYNMKLVIEFDLKKLSSDGEYLSNHYLFVVENESAVAFPSTTVPANIPNRAKFVEYLVPDL